MTITKWIAALIIVAVAAGFLGFTKPGRSVLNTLGLATACSDSCS
jgi:hypothetical protein